MTVKNRNHAGKLASAPRTKNKRPAVLTRKDLEQIVNDLACKVAPADVASLLQHEAELHQKIAALPEDLALLRRQLNLFLDCLRDYAAGHCEQIPLSTAAIAAAAILYFSNEVDLVPDFLPRLGKLDDAAVVSVAVERARKGLERYCLATGKNLQEVLPAARGRARSPAC